MQVDEFFRHSIFWITRCIAQGGYPEEGACRLMRDAGITHLFNVGTAPFQPFMSQMGFKGLVWKPVEDLKRVPDATALDCLDALHAILGEEGQKVYIHCVAGQNRSPSVLWLYLVACGMEPHAAEELIGNATLDAVPRHPDLVDDALMRYVQDVGRRRYISSLRAEVLEPRLPLP